MKVLVVGSINKDVVSYVKDFPRKGETIHSTNYYEFHGGKGANQAIAINRLRVSHGNKTLFFGKVGDDDTGRLEIENLEKNGINTEHVYLSKKQSGSATIIVSQSEKDNLIIVNGGANSDWVYKDLASLQLAINNSDLILIQLETSKFLVEHSLKIAKKLKKDVILNPAPSDMFNIKWLKMIKWLVPNKTELENIVGRKLITMKMIIKAGCELINMGLSNIIITLGSKGVIRIDKNLKVYKYKAFKAKTVDTTAAGDTFIGAFVATQELYGIDKAIQFANKAASITVEKKGAQSSIPTLEEVKFENQQITK